MRKKIFALVGAAVLALTLTACGSQQTSVPKLTVETDSSAVSGGEEARTKPDGAKYEDNLAGLLSYMQDGKAIVLDEGVTFANGVVEIAEDVTSFTQMSYQEIGAEDGYRCQFTFNGSTVQAEFYSFDSENLGEKGNACISSVKEKGYFEILDNEVQAVLHPSEKYLMIYTDSNADKEEENKTQKEWTQELFLSFQE